jgi:hypothetical protein
LSSPTERAVVENSPTMVNNKLATQAAETLDAQERVSKATVAFSEAATTGINMQLFCMKTNFKCCRKSNLVYLSQIEEARSTESFESQKLMSQTNYISLGAGLNSATISEMHSNAGSTDSTTSTTTTTTTTTSTTTTSTTTTSTTTPPSVHIF